MIVMPIMLSIDPVTLPPRFGQYGILANVNGLPNRERTPTKPQNRQFARTSQTYSLQVEETLPLRAVRQCLGAAGLWFFR